MPDWQAFNLFSNLLCMTCGVPQDAEEQTEQIRATEANRIAWKCQGWPSESPFEDHF